MLIRLASQNRARSRVFTELAPRLCRIPCGKAMPYRPALLNLSPRLCLGKWRRRSFKILRELSVRPSLTARNAAEPPRGVTTVLERLESSALLAFSSGLAWLKGCPGGASGFLMLSKTSRASFLTFLLGLFLGISPQPSGEIHPAAERFPHATAAFCECQH